MIPEHYIDEYQKWFHIDGDAPICFMWVYKPIIGTRGCGKASIYIVHSPSRCWIGASWEKFFEFFYLCGSLPRVRIILERLEQLALWICVHLGYQ